MDRLFDLETFVCVVEESSFSAAARRLGVTPSAVSRQISQLEDQLGARLFHRTTRQQSLSEAGELYLQHARRILDDMDAARMAVRRLTDAPAGRLHLTAEADLADRLIAPLLPGFLARWPEVQIHLSTSADLVDLIDGRLDLAVRMGHLDDTSLVARKLADSRSHLYAAPAYLARAGEPRHPRQLTDHACLSFRVGGGQVVWRFLDKGESLAVPVAGPLTVGSLVILRRLAVAEQGIIMLPGWSVREDVEAGRLVPILTEFILDPPTTPISAVFTHRRNLAPKVRAFVAHLAAHAETLCRG